MINNAKTVLENIEIIHEIISSVIIEIQGDNLEVIEGLTEEVKMVAAGFNELVNVESSFESGAPEIEIKAGVKGSFQAIAENKISWN